MSWFIAFKRTSELEAANKLLLEFVELCAAGDVDENTEALGWGDLITRAKKHLGLPVKEA